MDKFLYIDKSGEPRLRRIKRNPYGINNNPIKWMRFCKEHPPGTYEFIPLKSYEIQ